MSVLPSAFGIFGQSLSCLARQLAYFNVLIVAKKDRTVTRFRTAKFFMQLTTIFNRFYFSILLGVAGPDIPSPGLDPSGGPDLLTGTSLVFRAATSSATWPGRKMGQVSPPETRPFSMGIMRRIREWLGHLIFTASTWYAMPQALLGLSGTYIIFGDNVTVLSVLCGFPLPAGPCLTRFLSSVSGQDESIFCASALNENGLASGVPTGSQRGPNGVPTGSQGSPLGGPIGRLWTLIFVLGFTLR